MGSLSPDKYGEGGVRKENKHTLVFEKSSFLQLPPLVCFFSFEQGFDQEM